ncbi:MAG: transposase family protein [Chloroflexi bacterium]|nr:transposase family protein [Chloroflexota bacterium]
MPDQPSCRIRDCFAHVDDPRVARCQRHQLLDIITIARCGVLYGADRWTEVEESVDCRKPYSSW